MRKLIIWGSIFSGAIAAYLMYKRGASLGTIAQQTIAHPVGSLASELRAL